MRHKYSIVLLGDTAEAAKWIGFAKSRSLTLHDNGMIVTYPIPEVFVRVHKTKQFVNVYIEAILAIEGIFVRHYTSVNKNVVYFYDPEKAKAAELDAEKTYEPRYIGKIHDNAYRGLGVLGESLDNCDIYACDINGSTYKSEDLWRNAHWGDCTLAASSGEFIIESADDDRYTAYFIDIEGDHYKTVNLPFDVSGSVSLAINDKIIAYHHHGAFVPGQGSPGIICVADKNGLLLGSKTIWNIAYIEMAACNRQGAAFVTYIDGSFVVYVFSNEGVLIGEHVMPSDLATDLGGELSTIGMSGRFIYFIGASLGQPRCVVYNHRITTDSVTGLLASDMGGKYVMIDTPQVNNLADSARQTARMCFSKNFR